MTGLRSRMALSYVLVSAAAVLVVEAVLFGMLVPSLLSGSDQAARARHQAAADAKTFSLIATKIRSRQPDLGRDELLAQVAVSGFRATAISGGPEGATIPYVDDVMAEPPTAMEVLLGRDGRVVAGSAPVAVPPGSRLPTALPVTLDGHGVADARVAWAVSPVQVAVGESFELVGGVYVQVPAAGSTWEILAGQQPLLGLGVVVLLLAVPAGLAFGMLSTRGLIARVHRLSSVTAAVAGGDFGARAQVTPGDELGELEEALNVMAGRLGVAVQEEKRRVERDTRRGERARIARELHDSVSQDLFSIGLLADGLTAAMPADERLRPQAEAISRTAAHSMREMRALLLELRPVALEDAGLVPALHELGRVYEERLGLKVKAALEEVQLGYSAEHALLRVAQEALGNVARHAAATAVDLRLSGEDGAVVLELCDDGRGLDDARQAGRHGMGITLMRERVEELGGRIELGTATGGGTRVRVTIPADEGGQP
ncbi:sensor histidine kinase [Nonomuraea sp. NBC_00507]|uniref:HAMP domain-containing sensor histidine kinase n=1 Tax=Nonomuraea sp. NBC_00507 TaxID=2976002 RepID=UPI002E19A341